MDRPAHPEDSGGRPVPLPHNESVDRSVAASNLDINALTIDVEDYFQVEAFKGTIGDANWESMPMRVDRNTQRLIEKLSRARVKGTFFVLGWIAERYPHIVRKIHTAGHEIASHGYAHQLAHAQSKAVFRDDVRKAKGILEDICGEKVRGYRAPTFSVRRDNWWAYDVLAEEGYDYSSSLYPVSHDLYGTPDAPTTPFHPTASRLVEIPLSTIKLGRRNFPCSGGGYFRLLPYAASRWALRTSLEQRQSPLVFYCHPWEFDSRQPDLRAGMKSRFRHYTNIGLMPRRLSRLLRDFSWGRMDQVFARELGKQGSP
jgi:polysaccharide deacetylase family protein (PEP-CTERM system associated)